MAAEREKRMLDILRTTFEPDVLQLKDQSDGCGAKYFLVLVSSKFDGVSLLDRHRSVNKALETEMSAIHALTMKTWTPKQYEKKKATLSDGA